jgi:hypothetical protein
MTFADADVDVIEIFRLRQYIRSRIGELSTESLQEFLQLMPSSTSMWTSPDLTTVPAEDTSTIESLSDNSSASKSISHSIRGIPRHNKEYIKKVSKHYSSSQRDGAESYLSPPHSIIRSIISDPNAYLELFADPIQSKSIRNQKPRSDLVFLPVILPSLDSKFKAMLLEVQNFCDTVIDQSGPLSDYPVPSNRRTDQKEHTPLFSHFNLNLSTERTESTCDYENEKLIATQHTQATNLSSSKPKNFGMETLKRTSSTKPILRHRKPLSSLTDSWKLDNSSLINQKRIQQSSTIEKLHKSTTMTMNPKPCHGTEDEQRSGYSSSSGKDQIFRQVRSKRDDLNAADHNQTHVFYNSFDGSGIKSTELISSPKSYPHVPHNSSITSNQSPIFISPTISIADTQPQSVGVYRPQLGPQGLSC